MITNSNQPVTVQEEDPRSEDAAQLLLELSKELEALTGSTGEASFDLSDMDVTGAVFAIARDALGCAAGCGALRPAGDGVAEVKRVYTREKGIGVGSTILAFLEKRANELGYDTLRLETRKSNRRAVAFYLARGYSVTENYGKYRGRQEAVCFEKKL